MRVDEHLVDLRHDAAGRSTGFRVGDLAVDRTFDITGRLVEQITQAHPTPLLNLGEPTTETSVLRVDQYGYRADGIPTEHITTTDADIDRRGYDLDAIGRVLAVDGPNGPIERFTYDGLGNIISTGGPTSADPDNHERDRELHGTLLHRRGRTRYRYDSAGRLIAATTTRISRPAATTTYTYDDFDQLIAVTTPDGTRWSYTYDALGRRVEKVRAGADSEPTRFIWDGTHLAEEHGPERSLRWTYQPGTHTPLTQTRTAHVDLDQNEVDQQFHAIVADLIGTPISLIDADGGESVATSTTTLWGSTTWAGDSTPLRFPGQYHDSETGLHYNLLRTYDPATGRYLTPDPLGLAPAPNPNTYVNNPTAWTDPLGLAPEACRPSSFDPSEIRFSQRSVNGAAEIEAGMRENGWVGNAIDVVRMPDGDLTTVDNTRVLAASRAGINVEALVHAFDAPLPEAMAGRFTSPNGVLPSTWGEAIVNRIEGQGAQFRSLHPSGSPITGWSGN